MTAGAMAVMEVLARIHPFRYQSNHQYAQVEYDICDGSIEKRIGKPPSKYLNQFIGLGDSFKPIVGLSEMEKMRRVA